jgi:hypothetical protein
MIYTYNIQREKQLTQTASVNLALDLKQSSLRPSSADGMAIANGARRAPDFGGVSGLDGRVSGRCHRNGTLFGL